MLGSYCLLKCVVTSLTKVMLWASELDSNIVLAGLQHSAIGKQPFLDAYEFLLLGGVSLQRRWVNKAIRV